MAEMMGADLQAQIAAATAYEEFFVPAVFQEWAVRMVDAAHIQPGQRVLDVACGTGILARTAAARVGPTGFVAGLDRNPGMLTVAARLAPGIEWRQGRAESLPYAAQSFDAAVCQFGLMFFTDRRQALQEMERVLVPGGRLAVAVWDALEQIPAYAIEIDIIQRHAGPRAADPLRAPFVLGDRQLLASLFSSAGMAAADITTTPGLGRFPSIRSMVEADVRGWLPLTGVVLTEEQIEPILAEAEEALSAYVAADGTAVFDSPAHIVTATKP